MSAERQQQVLLAADRQQHHDAGDRQRLRQQHPFVRQQRPRLEHQHPGQQIQRQRQHPQQRRGGDVGGNMRGHRDQQSRGNGCQKNPAGAQNPRRGRRIAIVGRHVQFRRLRRRAQQQYAAGCDQHDQQAVAAGPDQVLRAQREHRLQQHRIGQQRQEAADIRRSIKEVRVGTVGVAGADEPGLQQRIVGGEREERQPDRHRKQAQQPERIARIRRIAPPARDRQRQRQHRDQRAAPDGSRRGARDCGPASENAHRHSRRAAATEKTPSPPTIPPANRQAAAAPFW